MIFYKMLHAGLFNHIIVRGLLLSREIAVNEELPCDRSRYLVGISNLITVILGKYLGKAKLNSLYSISF